MSIVKIGIFLFFCLSIGQSYSQTPAIEDVKRAHDARTDAINDYNLYTDGKSSDVDKPIREFNSSTDYYLKAKTEDSKFTDLSDYFIALNHILISMLSKQAMRGDDELAYLNKALAQIPGLNTPAGDNLISGFTITVGDSTYTYPGVK